MKSLPNIRCIRIKVKVNVKLKSNGVIGFLDPRNMPDVNRLKSFS
jgi:hypothetical protein